MTQQDFPVTWDDPADAGLCFEYERDHCPDPMTPLGFELYFGPFLGGFGWARAYHQNYYVFVWYNMPAGDSPPQVELEQVAAWVRAWHDEIIPEVEGLTQRFLRTDFDALSNDELASEIEALPELRKRMGQLHTRALLPHWLGGRHLLHAYKELTGSDDELAALRLVQGYGSKSVEAGVALWRLSRLATSIPAVEQLLRARLDTPATLAALAALERDPAARPFLEAFSAFLDEFGWRSDLFELAQPAWAEDPTIPLHQLRTYLDLPGYDPAREQARLAAERDQAIERTMASLDAEGRARLGAVLDVAQRSASLQEDHNFYIDQRCAFAPRRLILAAARRLFHDPAEVFYLHASELTGALRSGELDVETIARQRREEMAAWAQVTPPRWIGAPPSDGQAAQMSPFASEEAAANELRGRGTSAGVARGPARVLRSLSEADRLRPGDVLVARTTMPAWTPLFAVAAALVTEVGGMLSHPAVTAREYGLPAVLNVAGATTRIRDGQLVEVDGTNGIVRIVL